MSAREDMRARLTRYTFGGILGLLKVTITPTPGIPARRGGVVHCTVRAVVPERDTGAAFDAARQLDVRDGCTDAELDDDVLRGVMDLLEHQAREAITRNGHRPHDPHA